MWSPGVLRRVRLLEAKMGSHGDLSRALMHDLAASVYQLPPSPLSDEAVDQRWLVAVEEGLSRLRGDSALLAEMFSFDAGRVVSAEAGLSDPHDGQRTVTLYRDANGAAVVYKPRPVSMDAWISDVLRWCAKRGLNLYAPVYLERAGYGWMECIEPAECECAQDVERFYFRTGQWLCLAYLFGGRDFHYENVIAQGSHPVIVDAECFLVPDWSTRSDNQPDSVLDTGWLPNWSATLSGGWADCSALGRPVITPDKGSNNGCAPRLDGYLVDYRFYVPQIMAGFERAWRFFSEHGPSLLKHPLMQTRAPHCLARLTLRPTARYVNMLRTAVQYQALAEVDDIAGVINAALRAEPASVQTSVTMAEELRHLVNGDVPSFRISAITSRPVFAGEEYGADTIRVPASSGLAQCFARLESLSGSALNFQLQLVRMALSIHMPRVTNVGGILGQPSRLRDVGMEGAGNGPARLRQCAVEAGDILLARGWHGEHGIVWAIRRHQGNPDISALDWPSGAAGIGMFMAALAQLTGAPRFRDAAESLLQMLCRSVRQSRDRRVRSGYYEAAGVLHALAFMPSCLGRELPQEAGMLASALMLAESNDASLARGYAGDALILQRNDLSLRRRPHRPRVASVLPSSQVTASPVPGARAGTNMAWPHTIHALLASGCLHRDQFFYVAPTAPSLTSPGLLDGALGVCVLRATEAQTSLEQSRQAGQGLRLAAAAIAGWRDETLDWMPCLARGAAGVGLACLILAGDYALDDIVPGLGDAPPGKTHQEVRHGGRAG